MVRDGDGHRDGSGGRQHDRERTRPRSPSTSSWPMLPLSLGLLTVAGVLVRRQEVRSAPRARCWTTFTLNRIHGLRDRNFIQQRLRGMPETSCPGVRAHRARITEGAPHQPPPLQGGGKVTDVTREAEFTSAV